MGCGWASHSLRCPNALHGGSAACWLKQAGGEGRAECKPMGHLFTYAKLRSQVGAAHVVWKRLCFEFAHTEDVDEGTQKFRSAIPSQVHCEVFWFLFDYYTMP